MTAVLAIALVLFVVVLWGGPGLAIAVIRLRIGRREGEDALDTATTGPPIEAAGRGRRLAAVLLDGVLALPLLLIAEESGYANTDGVDPVGLAALAGFSVLTNVQIYLLATSGQTIAKRVMQIRIVDAGTGRYPGWLRIVILRAYVNGLFVAVTFGLYGLVDTLFIFREDRRTLHDRLARTRVDRVGA